MTTAAATSRPATLMRNSAWDMLLVALAGAHAVALVVWPSLGVVAIGLSREDVTELLAFMETNAAKQVRESMRYGLLSRLAELDPQAALDYANKLTKRERDNALGTVVSPRPVTSVSRLRASRTRSSAPKVTRSV